MTTKVRDKHDTAVTMGAHEYQNIELVEIDGILRVRKKSTQEIMPMVNSQRKVKNRAW